MRVSLELKPSTSAGHDASTIVALITDLLSIKVDTVTADQLRDDHPLRTVDYESTSVGHPGVFAQIKLLLLDLTGRPIYQLDVSVQGRCVVGVIPNSLLVRYLGLTKMIVLKAEA